MPNLTFAVAADRPPIIELVVTVPEPLAVSRASEGRTVPPPMIVPALLDTGASASLISGDIIDRLDLEVFGSQAVFGVGGTVSAPGIVSAVGILYPGIPPDRLASAAPVIAVPNLNHLGARMILGRDLLSRCVLIYNGPHGTCTFAF